MPILRQSRPQREPHDLPTLGNSDASVIVIADAPTIKQWQAGVPMDGKAWGLFTELAHKFGFGQQDFFFISPCAPIPEIAETSEKKTKLYIDQFRDALKSIIATRCKNGRLFMYLGKNAGYALTGRPGAITKQRGVVRRVDGTSLPVLPFLSPQHVLRRPEVMELFEADWNMLRILKNGGWDVNAAADAVADVHYEWRDDLSDIIAMHPASIAHDTEGVGLKWYAAETQLLTWQMSYEPGQGIIVPLKRWPMSQFPDISDRKLFNLRRQVKILCEDRTIKKAGHNIKFDHHMLRREGIEVAGWTVDNLLLAFCVDENMTEKSQDECVRRWVPEMAGYADTFNRDPVHCGKSRMDLVPPDKMLQYGCGDSDGAFRLAKRLVPLVMADKRQWTCYQRVIFPAMRAFMDVVEPAGIMIDTAELASLQTTLEQQEAIEYQGLIDMVPNAVKRRHLAEMTAKQQPQDVLSFSRDTFTRDVLFSPDGFNLKPKVFTPTTAKLPEAERIPSVSTKTHLPYFDDHPFIPKLIRYQQIAKLRSTYVGEPAYTETLPDGREVDVNATGFWKYLDRFGFIHPSFALHKTVTGRTASSDPNGQNFPKRGPLAKAYRKIFVARPGYTLIECDLSQAELRIAAWMSGDPTMLAVYRSGGDIHMATALIVSNLSEEAFAKLPDHLKKEYRQKAKSVNFGFLYGMGWRKFMAYAKTDYGVVFTEREAQAVRDAFFRKYKRLEGWHRAMREFVKKNGYVRALHGALRNLPNIFSIEEYIVGECERQAINSPVQRLGSDIGLVAMGRLCRDADPDLLRPVAFIHDALVVEVRNDYVEQATKAVKFFMESMPWQNWFGLTPPLPIVADVSVGPNLAEMEEIKGVTAEAPDWYRWDLDGYKEKPTQFVYQTVS